MQGLGFRYTVQAADRDDDGISVVADAIRLVFEKFRELGSSRQVYLWFLAAGLSLPVVRIRVRIASVLTKKQGLEVGHDL